MRIGNRLFCYPVLCRNTQDYQRSTFFVDAGYALSGLDALELTFRISMNCPALQALIDSGDAAFAVHVECSQTSFRKIRMSRDPVIEERLSREQVRGAFERSVLVVLLKDLSNFSSPDFDPDYGDMTFRLSKGSILAYETLPILDVEPVFNEMGEGHSIFTVFRNQGSDDGQMKVEINEEHILIGLRQAEFTTYARYALQPDLQPLLNSAIVFPALIYALEQLKMEGAVEDYADRAWYRTLDRDYAARGTTLADTLGSGKTTVEIAQELMKQPVAQALRSIDFAEDSEETAEQ